jgi:uncharacterized membrane protein
MENKKRSALKSVAWRITGVIILVIVTFAYTKSWVQTGLVTLIHHSTFLLVFYLHERAWLLVEVESRLKRSLLKMFTYETLCGNIILGTITYCVTGDVKQMTAVTLTYIGIKHAIYIFNEFIWDKIKWGKTQ